MNEIVRVIKGDPTAEELAALISVISAMQASAVNEEKSMSEWNAPHRTVRQPIQQGPNVWRRSALPQ